MVLYARYYAKRQFCLADLACIGVSDSGLDPRLVLIEFGPPRETRIAGEIAQNVEIVSIDAHAKPKPELIEDFERVTLLFRYDRQSNDCADSARSNRALCQARSSGHRLRHA